MLLLYTILVIVMTVYSAILCAGVVQFGAYFFRQGGSPMWLSITLWFGCPAWGLWQGDDPAERMLWIGFGALTGAGILLELYPPSWWRRNDNDGDNDVP